MSSFTRFSAEMSVAYALDESTALKRDMWRITTGYRYYIGHEDSDSWVDVPRGYLFNGADVPRVAWSIIPPWGRYGQAVGVHDILCEYMQITERGVPKTITRERADAIFAEAMMVLGVDQKDQDIINTAVALYRKATGKASKSPDPLKRQLEAQWAAKHLN